MDLDRQRSTVPAFDKNAIFRRHELFRALGPEVCDQLATYAKMKDVARGATIFVKGSPGTCLFAVCRGVVLVTSTSSDGKSLFLNEINEGEIFGEIALLDGQPRTADAAAFTDCSLIIIERRDFLPLLRNNPDVTLQLIEILCARLRRTTEQVEDLIFMDLRGRLAKTLLRLSKGAVRQAHAGDLARRTQPDRRTVAGNDQPAAPGLGPRGIHQARAPPPHYPAARRTGRHRDGFLTCIRTAVA